MDAERFDDLLRSIGSGATRRSMLAGLVGGIAASGIGIISSDAVTDAKRKRKKRKKPKCTCDGRVCGPNSCGAGSCGDCGACKSCEGGACVPKVNGTSCGGSCRECQDGVCVNRANGTDCGGGLNCLGGECGCLPGNRVCGEICCPLATVCLNAQTGQCVSAQGSCPSGGDFCEDRQSRCGNPSNPECFCYQTVAGETRCGVQISPIDDACVCTNDSGCASYGPGAFCASDAVNGICANCFAANSGFCAVPCST